MKLMKLLDRWAARGIEKWHDPTHGQIDRDIQEKVALLYADDPHVTLVQRVAVENTLQEHRNRERARHE